MRVARLLSLAGAMLVLLAVPSIASASSHTFWRASAPNQLWVDPGAGTAGLSVLSVPNIGCTAVDANGFCTGGIYPSLHGARWIWKAHETVEEQNTSDYGPVIFVRRIDVPKKADTVDAQIKITADNAYDLFVNGAPVGRFMSAVPTPACRHSASFARHWSAEPQIAIASTRWSR